MALQQKHTLPKAERLCSKKDISALLEGGRFFSVGIIRCCVRKDNGCAFSRIMVSVPKRSFKRAVKRNLLKRRIREAYRLQKEILAGKNVDLLFIYTPKEVLGSKEIHEAVGKALARIAGESEKKA